MTIDNIEFPQTSNQKKNNINQPGCFPRCITPLKFNMGYQEMAIFQKDSPFQNHHSWGPSFVNFRGCIRWAPTIAINGVMGPNKSESLASFSLKLLHSSPGGVAGIPMATPARVGKLAPLAGLVPLFLLLLAGSLGTLAGTLAQRLDVAKPIAEGGWWCTPTTPGGTFTRTARPFRMKKTPAAAPCCELSCQTLHDNWGCNRHKWSCNPTYSW